MQNPTKVHFMVALPCEAKPLVRHFGMSRLMDESTFSIYRKESYTLTVSGVGKTAMAAATAYTFVASGKPAQCVWLNVGVAGHSEYPTGRIYLIHKISDKERRRSWYPPIIARPPCETESLITVAHPETNYTEAALYDMEASAFYETAGRFTSSELVQCLKIVSDNRLVAADSVQPKQIVELIAKRIDLIERLIDQLIEISSGVEVPKSKHLEGFERRWRFSVQQKMQLEMLLQKWALLDLGSAPDPKQLDYLNSGRQVLDYLRGEVDKITLRF